MKFNILCVDEYRITGLELSGLLKDYSINFINARDEIEAVNILRERKAELNAVIWTINTDNLKDFEVISQLKGKECYRHIPIVIVSRLTDKKYIIKAVESGAVEYIAKPYDEEIVMKKMCRILEVPCDKTLSSNVDDDIVTFNFSEMFNKEIKAASRGGHPLSVMLVSIMPEGSIEPDGEYIGDIVTLANRVIRTKLRETDTLFHYGINNLIILLPFASKEGSKSVAKRIHDLFNTHTLIKQKSRGLKLMTASVTFPDDGKVKDMLLEKLEDDFVRCLKEEAPATGSQSG